MFEDPRLLDTRAKRAYNHRVTIQPCPECARLHAAYADARERLAAAQRELARYKTPPQDFERLWMQCNAALDSLAKVRAEMTAHSAKHAPGGVV